MGLNRFKNEYSPSEEAKVDELIDKINVNNMLNVRILLNFFAILIGDNLCFKFEITYYINT